MNYRTPNQNHTYINVNISILCMSQYSENLSFAWLLRDNSAITLISQHAIANVTIANLLVYVCICMTRQLYFTCQFT